MKSVELLWNIRKWHITAASKQWLVQQAVLFKDGAEAQRGAVCWLCYQEECNKSSGEPDKEKNDVTANVCGDIWKKRPARIWWNLQRESWRRSKIWRFGGDRADVSLCSRHLPDVEADLIYLFLLWEFTQRLTAVLHYIRRCCVENPGLRRGGRSCVSKETAEFNRVGNTA